MGAQAARVSMLNGKANQQGDDMDQLSSGHSVPGCIA